MECLSPGEFYKLVPKDPIENLRFRLKVYAQGKTDPVFRKGIAEIVRQDILFYINTFVWQFNPTQKSLDRMGPFITWDFQDRALLDRPETTKRRGILWCYENNRSVVVEKSRRMGASWLFLIVQDWLALTQPYFQSLNISRSADAVDSKSPDSLFWKLRHIHRHLPDWLKGKLIEQSMFFEYKNTEAVVTGEASTGRAGVGGRASVIFVDEFPQIKEDVEVRQRTANTADCRFFNGTHLGDGTEFYKLTKTPEFVKIVMHWTDHPEMKKGLYRYDVEKNQVEVLDKSYVYPDDFEFVRDGSPTGGPHPGVRSPLYDKKCAEIGDARGVAMELDIDPKGAASQAFDSITIANRKAEWCIPPFWTGDLHFDQETGRPFELVPRKDGQLKLWLNPRDNKPPLGLYCFGADLSWGQGASNSCISGLNALTGEKILEYADPNTPPKELASMAVALCWLFKNENGEGARFAWEHHGPGIAFGQKVIELGYRNFYFRTNEFSLRKKTTDSPGWFPTPDNKDQLLKEYAAALSARQFVNRSWEALDECLSFQYGPSGHISHSGEEDTKDPSGARGNHGDRVIADALAWKMAKAHWRPERKIEEDSPKPGSLAFRKQWHEIQKRAEKAWV